MASETSKERQDQLFRKDLRMAIESGQAIAPQQDVQTPVAVGAPTKASPERSRLLFLDNVRVLLIILVIAGHLAMVYGGAGSWVYQEPKPRHGWFTNPGSHDDR